MDIQLNESLENMRQWSLEKNQHLENILELTRKQEEVLDGEQSEQLLQFIEEKQKHIDVVNTLDDKFTNTYQQIKGQLESPGFRMRNPQGYQCYLEIKEMIGEIQKTAGVVYQLEKKNSQRLQQVMEDIKVRLKRVGMGKKGYAAYKKPAQIPDAFFIDKKK